MKQLDRYCCLIFDEMWVEAALSYDKGNDQILGFENVSGKKTVKFADHAMVVMLRGIHKKWKQPFCFHFSEGGMSAANVAVHVIKAVVSEAQNIGLNVVATVCDQLSINSRAISLLKKETDDEFMRQNKENRLFGFTVNDQEVCPLYDTPHLLKGLRNNFLDAKGEKTNI